MDRRSIPAGALLAGLSFFLPYIQSPEIFGRSATATGAQLGGWAWAVPLTAGVILLGYVLWDSPQSRDVARRLMTGGSLLGLGLLLYAVFELTRDRFLGASAWDIGVRPAIGPFLTLAGFLLALAGARQLPRGASGAPLPAVPLDEGAVATAAQSAAPVGPPITDELAKQARAAGRLLAEWSRAALEGLRRLDLPGRYARNRRRVWASAGAFTLAVIVYLVMRPSPEELARSSALAFTTCRDAYAAEVKKAEQTLLPRVASGAFRTRGEALAAWNQLLEERRPRYVECVSGAQQGFARAQGRFTGRRLERFFTAYIAPSSADASEVESATTSADLFARIHAVRAPAPGEAEVRQHLLGRRVDGWSFDEPSEFRALRLSQPRVQGDTLRVHAEADLTDYVSQEPYVAVLELRYAADDEGEWRLDGVEPVVVAPASAEYRIGGQVFLVGRWRWPQNYAIYNADGTWSGRWDNGGEESGRWRIVRDHLIVTWGRSNSWSGRLHSWSADSMRVGDGSGTLVQRWHGPAAGGAAPQAAAPDTGEAKRARIEDPDGYTNLRARPSTDAAIVTRIDEGQEFSVMPSAGDWWRVRTAAGDTGYVHRSRIRLVP